MAKVTSKLQVTLPKAIATQYRIKPGDDILWVAAGDAIRVVPARSAPRSASPEERLRVFDHATERQLTRQADRGVGRSSERGWKREELYQRGRPR
jgi:bifunctional DNA-binding transcriptional regulator/antitoxin component of YhaV-PrlF toxin-antitoxin module